VGSFLVLAITIPMLRKYEADAFRRSGICSAVYVIHLMYSNETLKLLGNQEYALIEDNEDNRLFYKISDTVNAIAEIGFYIPSNNGIKLAYGVDLRSNEIYIYCEMAEYYYVDENIFPITMTHGKLLEFFRQNRWQKYQRDRKGRIIPYKGTIIQTP
jgi:hypothetical protein